MTYWIAQNGGRNRQSVYHTEKQCKYLAKARGSKQVDKEHIEYYDLTECKHCAGTAETGVNAGNRTYQKLAKEMAKDD